MAKTNFLIGRGELLTNDIPGPKEPQEKLRFTLFMNRNNAYCRKLHLLSKILQSYPVGHVLMIML
jgi:hypothetical protein